MPFPAHLGLGRSGRRPPRPSRCAWLLLVALAASVAGPGGPAFGQPAVAEPRHQALQTKPGEGDGGESEQVDEAADAIATAIGWADDAEADLSIAAAVTASGTEVDLLAFSHVDEVELASEFGANADELSAWWGTEEGSDGDDLLVLGGYGGLADHLADGLDVRLGTAVLEVSWGADGADFTLADGALFTCDRLVVTVPLAVLAADDITFDPPLPDTHRAAIDTMGTGLLDKVWFVFPEQFWSNESLMWTRVDETGTPFREWFNLAPLTGEPVLLALHGGRTARAWAERSDDELRAAGLAALQQFLDAGW
jgi:hypothetical protein